MLWTNIRKNVRHSMRLMSTLRSQMEGATLDSTENLDRSSIYLIKRLAKEAEKSTRKAKGLAMKEIDKVRYLDLLGCTINRYSDKAAKIHLHLYLIYIYVYQAVSFVENRGFTLHEKVGMHSAYLEKYHDKYGTIRVHFDSCNVNFSILCLSIFLMTLMKSFTFTLCRLWVNCCYLMCS